MENAWEVAHLRGATSVVDLLKSVSADLHEWDRNVLGDLQQRIKKLKKELEDCRCARISASSIHKEQVTRFKLERLEEQLDMFWRQRAHANWLEKGDTNSAYLHSFASERKRRNTIGKLKADDGTVVEGEEGLQTLITNYFDALFSSLAGANIDAVLHAVGPRVTSSMNEHLMAEFTAAEVKDGLDGIGDLKAPGPDGMPAIFYKRFWQLVGEKLTQEVLAVLQGGGIPEGWNQTTVVLIPKVQRPETLRDLRPISLCNVLYKIVSKVLANRLKCILGDLISQNQSAFIPGCIISDNIILAYELTHHMKRKKRGGTNYMALKLDMSKAYDRVEWHFLEGIMKRMGFCDAFTGLIKKCVETVTYRFKVNGGLTDMIIPGRGLRQGDPLSPYLFLLCAEGFSALLQQAERAQHINGISICQGAPQVNHLLFADDSLLFMKANPEAAQEINTILNVYEES